MDKIAEMTRADIEELVKENEYMKRVLRNNLRDFKFINESAERCNFHPFTQAVNEIEEIVGDDV